MIAWEDTGASDRDVPGYYAPWEGDDEEPEDEQQPAETGVTESDRLEHLAALRNWRAHLSDDSCPF